MARQPVNLIETMCCYLFDKGPGLDVHQMTITGPIRLIKGVEEIEQQRITTRFLGDRNGRSDSDYAESILRPLVDKAFRHPATKLQLEKYTSIALEHVADGHRFEDGIHLTCAPCSVHPNFLYRGHREGELDDYDLAARLSFFLTSSPPDTSLQKFAALGKLSESDHLEAQTRRLLKHHRLKLPFLPSQVNGSICEF